MTSPSLPPSLPPGQMHSLFYFNSTLSDNEISVFAQAPPLVHTQPDCRCPPSHPVARETVCENPSGSSQLPRVNTDTHHPSLLNDDSISSWWQSETQEAPVNVTVSLGGLRAALTVAVIFRSFQPESMVLYYSSDGGQTFSPRQYYSSDCSRFGLPDNGLLRSAQDVNCITSESAPLPNLVTDFRILDVGNRPEAGDYSRSVPLQEFARATHIRLQLLSWNTAVPREQYFAISEVMVWGQECLCNGHADTCMGSACVCQHNTAGVNCDLCLPLFNNKPWAMGTTSSANQCEACECNDHASSCIYNATLSSGMCSDCGDNTEGSQCELCLPLFYNPPGVATDAPDTCQACDCHLPGVTDTGDCISRGMGAGQCSCKPFTTGRRCNQCQTGYYNLSASNSDGCLTCGCDSRGTVDNDLSCDQMSGQCQCKQNVVGRDCSACAPGHFGISNEEGCLPCDPQCDECTGPGPTNCQVRIL